MLVVVLYLVWRGKERRKGTFTHRYGPLILMFIAFPLVMSDQVRHVMQDIDWWPSSKGSNEYRFGCHDENYGCLSVIGWLFTVVFTYVGFIALGISVLWNANIIKKCKQIGETWKQLRQ